jgi:hypothetical protein
MTDNVGAGTVSQLLGKHRALQKVCLPPSRRFTGKVEILWQLEWCFFPAQTSTAKEEQHIFVLYGIGVQEAHKLCCIQ